AASNASGSACPPWRATASSRSRLEPKRWTSVAADSPTSAATRASVSRAGPSRAMTRAAAARTASSSTVRCLGSGLLLGTGALRQVLGVVRAPVGPLAVHVGEAVLAREPPARERPTRPAGHVRVARERGRRPADEPRRLREREVRILLGALAPVRLADAQAIQHGLRAQEARSERERGDAVRPQLLV